MGTKKITDLQLIDSVAGTLNIPGDDGIQTYRLTAAQLKTFILSAGSLTADTTGRAVMEDGYITKAKLNYGAKYITSYAASADYAVLDNDGYEVILMTTGGTNKTITLPTLADNIGRVIRCIKADSDVGVLIVKGEASGETINGISGTTGVEVAFQNEEIALFATASGWYYIGQHYSSFSVTSPTITSGGTSPSGSVKGTRVGRIVTISASITTGASGSPGATVGMTTPLPSIYRPPTSVYAACEFVSATDSYYVIEVANSGSIAFTRFQPAGSTDLGTASWANGVTEKFNITYHI
jgi:hypothetical protein